MSLPPNFSQAVDLSSLGKPAPDTTSPLPGIEVTPLNLQAEVLPLSSSSSLPKVRSSSTDSAERGDQHRTTTGLVSERGKTSACKLSGVTSSPGSGEVVSGAGFPSLLRSTACEKLGGKLMTSSSLLHHAIYAYIDSRVATVWQNLSYI